jgi:3-deoxy-D-manno-octulosonate 8-phosphate phosphatase (KDO 8-P phosphatase)
LPSKNIPKWENVHTIVFDFDGVFTDNKVWVDQNGVETVRCDRRDGLGLDLLRNFMRVKNWFPNYFILSKECNQVVALRAEKIQVFCVQSVSNKAEYLLRYLGENNLSVQGLVYLGNDLNDLAAMQISGFSFAPADAHPVILKHADFVVDKNGGEGFVRAFIEMLIGLEMMTIEEVCQLS